MKYFFFFFFIFICFSTYSQKKESTIYFRNGDTMKSLATMRKGKIVTFDDSGKKKKLDFRTVSHIDYGQGQATGVYYYKIQNGYNIPKLVELYKEGNLCLYGVRAMYQDPGFGYHWTTLYYVGRKEPSPILIGPKKQPVKDSKNMLLPISMIAN